MAGKWHCNAQGIWTSTSEHSTAAQPTVRGITQGRPPAGRCALPKRKINRRYDAVTEEQISKLRAEDDAELQRDLDVAPVYQEAARDLRSGKIRIREDVIKERDRNVVPFKAVEDDRGVTTIVPDDLDVTTTVKIQPGVAEASPLEPTPTLKQLMNRGFRAVEAGDGSHLRRTV